LHKKSGILFTLFSGNKKSLSDDELIQRFRSSNNPEYLGELYGRYMHLVYGVCLKYLKNREDSKDAVMQIFEKLLTDLPSYEIRNFKALLYVITKNYCLMQLRSGKTLDKKIKLWQNDPANFMESEPALHPIDNDCPDSDKALRDCIDKLKDEQKVCIEKFYFENRSYREISAFHKMDEKKVKSLLQNAKRNLKICLENKNA
jgi:RNA polymerase sigma-70 factor (ECF subfamily)